MREKEKRIGLRKIWIFSGLRQIVQMESRHMKLLFSRARIFL